MTICGKLKTIFDTLNDAHKNIILWISVRNTDVLEWKSTSSVTQHDMNVYLGKDRCADQDETASHVMVRDLYKRVNGVGQKLYIDNFFSSWELFDDLIMKISICRTRLMQHRTLTKEGKGIRVRVRGDMTVLVWKDKWDAHNAEHAQTSSRRLFLWRAWKCIKPAIVEAYGKHVLYVNKSVRMTIGYSISRHTWKWTQILFFHLLDLSVPNSFILWCKFVAPRLHTYHRLKHAGTCKGTSSPKTPCRLPTALSSRVSHLVEASWQHWPTCLPHTRRWIKSKTSPIALYNINHRQNPFKSNWPTSSVKGMNCRVCSAWWKRSIVTMCNKCDAGLYFGVLWGVPYQWMNERMSKG
jgi:hypothetical protein